MRRAIPRRDEVALATRARLILVGAVGALLLIGALSAGAAGASSLGQDQAGRESYVVRHEATVGANATAPTRSPRVIVPGAFLLVIGAAALIAQRASLQALRRSRRHLEQFPVRRRGPPVLLHVAH